MQNVHLIYMMLKLCFGRVFWKWFSFSWLPLNILKNRIQSGWLPSPKLIFPLKHQRVKFSYQFEIHHLTQIRIFIILQTSYWFECQCAACTNNWPCFMKLPRDYFKLSGAHFKYKRCNRKELQKDVDKLKKRIRQTILEEKKPLTMDDVPNHYEAARKMFNDWMNLLDELLVPASHQVRVYYFLFKIRQKAVKRL